MPQRLTGTPGADDTPVLEVRDVHKGFVTGGLFGGARRVIPAVDGVSFSVPRGRTTAILGESGCGKSTLARTILHLHRADAGKILLLGTEVQDLDDRAFRPHRRHVQMVFQNPLGSFDPMLSIGSSIAETMRLRRSETDGPGVGDLLTEVGLSPRFATLRPRGISGGELQRAAIARALATRPELVVMDEPTSALDMSIKGQVLQLMRDLQERHQLSYLIAAHDLLAVQLVAHEVIVMYLGQVVEQAPAAELFARPRHPYTRGLLYAHDLGGRSEERERTLRIRGTLRYPEPGYEGCRLVERCPLAVAGCREPQALETVAPGHGVRCWRAVAGEIPDLEGAHDAHPLREPGRQRSA
jgi:peptide/nickel transport system ATP-binding protein